MISLSQIKAGSSLIGSIVLGKNRFRYLKMQASNKGKLCCSTRD